MSSLVVAEYIYRDEDGAPLRCKLRYPDKSFRWQVFDPFTDEWVWGAHGTAHATLYNLDKLKPGPVFCTEGEKDADSVTALDLVAVTSGEAGSWQRHHADQLHQHGCSLAVVLPDHDAKGRYHAYDVARENLAVGIPTKIVELPDLNEHEDVTDYIDSGGTRELLVGLARCTQLVTLADLPVAPARPRRSESFDQTLNFAPFYREKLKLSPRARGHQQVLCPFHVDGSPSRSLDLTRGVWYCHGCGIGGGPVAFFQKWHARTGKTITRSEAWRRLKATYL